MFYTFFWTLFLTLIVPLSIQLLIFYCALPQVFIIYLKLFQYDHQDCDHCFLYLQLFILFFILFFLPLGFLSCFLFLFQSGLRRHLLPHHSLYHHRYFIHYFRCFIHFILCFINLFRFFLIIFFFFIHPLNSSFSNFLIFFFILLIRRHHCQFFILHISYGD